MQQVLWLLKHGLLQQLHTYVYLAPPPTSSDSGSGRLSGREIGGTGQLGSHGTSSPASTSIPTPTVNEPPPLSHDPPSLTPHPQQSHQADIIGDALHHAAVQLSQPASESDLGSGKKTYVLDYVLGVCGRKCSNFHTYFYYVYFKE